MKRLTNYFDLIFFTVSILLIDILFRSINGFSIFSLKPLFFNAMILMVVISIIILFKEKMRIIVEISIVSLLSIYSFAQSYHYIFFNTVFSLKKITIINELIEVKDSVFSKFDLKLLLFVLPLFIFCFLIQIIKKKLGNTPSKIKYVIFVVLLFVPLVFLGTMEINSINEPKNDIENEMELYHSLSNKNRFVNRYGLYTFLYKDIQNIILENDEYDISDSDKKWIENYISNKSLSKNEYTGLLKNKNLIMIQAESFCPQAIDEYLTPTLYKLKNNSLYFDNFYCPLYPSNTCDTEFIVQTSLVPSINYGTTSKTFASNNYKYSLAHLFTQSGYLSNSYHSFYKDFYNRSQFHESLGFNYIFDHQDMSLFMQDYFVDFTNWIDDLDLIKGVISNTNMSSNFYDLVISASGHSPYKENRSELYDFQLKAIEYLKTDQRTAYYYASQMKLDEAVKYLLKYLQEKNLLDDTVVVIYGDHYPYGVKESTYNYLYSGIKNEYEVYKTPLFIINSSLPNRTISKLCSSFDLYPTLVNLFGLEIDQSFYVGEDILSNNECIVRFSDGSVLTNDLYYSPDLFEGSELSKEELETVKQNSAIMNYSQIFLSSNYYDIQNK